MHDGVMDLRTLVNTHGGQAAFARKINCERQVLNRILKGRRGLGPGLAIRIERATGHKLGPLSEDAE